MKIDPRAGQLAIASDLVDVPKLIAAYYEERPDPDIAGTELLSYSGAGFHPHAQETYEAGLQDTARSFHLHFVSAFAELVYYVAPFGCY